MAHDMTPAEQEDGIYNGMVEIARRCDGAQAKDMVGFNGVDTHFGRRIAMVPRSQWTPEIMAECAHIILKYREQVLTYTGLDVGTFPMVKAAQDNGTNYTARNQAKGFEQRAKHLAARQIVTLKNWKGRTVLGVKWANGDPEFDLFLGLVKALPGRNWNRDAKVNEVTPTLQVEAFINEYDFTPTPEAQAMLEALAKAPAQAPQAEVSYQIWMHGQRVAIKTNLTAPGQPAADAVRMLPGRSFDRGLYANTANATPDVLAFAARFNLNVHPDAVAACEAAGAALVATDGAGLSETDLKTVLNTVSRTGKPEDLPEAFVMMLKEILP